MSQIPQNILKEIQLAKTKQLRELSLRSRSLKEIPPELFKLEDLEFLDLSYNLLTSIPASISQLKNLKGIRLNNNRLGPTSFASMTPLQNLNYLNLNQNQLTTIPKVICHLQNLRELYLVDNLLTTIPDFIIELKNLTKLVLSNNQFTLIPDVIYRLSSLRELFIGNVIGATSKNQITEISPKIRRLENLKILDLNENPIGIPPPEIVANGLEAIKEYFRQLEQEGLDYLYEAKLLIVGEGAAGKTTLARKIENSNYQLRDNEASTKGIDVVRWEFPLPRDLDKSPSSFVNPNDLNKTFRINIWDFGGQEIYYATHQFFLTRRSLYVLVADTRREDTNFFYWLSVVELLSDNSPLLIIKNEIQDRPREINERQLRGQFTNLEKILATNLATNRGLPEVVDEIKYCIIHLPHVGTALPKTWVKVREALENDPRNYISLDDYQAICQQHDFTELKDKLQLSGYLHDLGVCLHFQDDPLLKKTVILKPEWGTAAVYKVLDNQRVINNLGQFNRADLTDIWNEAQYAGMQDELLQLMMKFKLCYPIPGNADTFIAPQLLTENQPDYEWNETNNLRLRYKYDFMPKGILTQFIVATHPLIAEQRTVWKSGVILKKDQATAEVIEHQGKHEIIIRVVGKRRKDLLTIIIYELDKIHASYRRLKPIKLIPCNCTQCKTSSDPHFYNIDILHRFADDQQPNIQCQQSYQMVEVLGLIDDVMERGDLFRQQQWDFEPIQQDYNTKQIRTLLTKGFNNAELRRLCHDETEFNPVFAELAQTTGTAEIIDRLLEFAKRQDLIEVLLDWAKAKNPAKYEKFKPYQ